MQLDAVSPRQPADLQPQRLRGVRIELARRSD
jgi:hypothetical protein